MLELEELIRKIEQWKELNGQKKCAICGQPLPRIVVDASYQRTTITRDVSMALKMWDKLPEDLRKWIRERGIAVCTSHLT
jgi:hypothetical protein